MKRHAQTIQIFLPDGEPRGLRTADITTRIVQVTVTPRTILADVDRPELKRVGLYLLFGESDGGKPTVYIGEAEDCLKRLKQHTTKKDFWTTAAVVTAKTDTLTKAHGRYLEFMAVNQAKEAGRYLLDNSTTPSEPFVTEPQKAEIAEIFETTATLLATLGFPVFEPVMKQTSTARTFYFKRKKFSAVGTLTEDGFVVYQDSTASATEYPSTTSSVSKARANLVSAGVLIPDGEIFRFTSDHLFSSPSAAGCAVNGHNVNGWTVWKTESGEALSEVFRS